MRNFARATLVVCLSGCAPSTIVSLNQKIPISSAPDAPLEVQTRSTGVHDPVAIPGSGVAFAGLEESLGHAVASAVVPWADQHRAERPGGWQLVVELIEAHAEKSGQRLLVTVGARATLRARTGNVYLAQTQVHCRQSALVDPAEASPVFYDCLLDLGRELNGWLGGVRP